MTDKPIIYYKKDCFNEPYYSLGKVIEQLDQLKAEKEKLKKECEIWKNQVLTLDDEDITVQITQRQFEEYNKLKTALAEVKEIAEPYRMTIKKICGNCKKYNDCHACCYKDINCYKYTSSETNACEEFVYLDEFIPNLLANNVLQKISECEVEDD